MINVILLDVPSIQCHQIGQFIALFRACGNDYFDQIAHIFREIL